MGQVLCLWQEKSSYPVRLTCPEFRGLSKRNERVSVHSLPRLVSIPERCSAKHVLVGLKSINYLFKLSWNLTIEEKL